MIRMINTRAHALLDYLLGVVLVAAPALFDFSIRGAGYVVCIVVASLVWLLAATTRFEYALIQIIPLRLHLWADLLIGVILSASPFIWNFSDEVFKPHLVFGLTLCIVAALTDRVLHDKIRKSSENVPQGGQYHARQSRKEFGKK